MSLLDRIHACNRWDDPERYWPWWWNGERLGTLNLEATRLLTSHWPEQFVAVDRAIHWRTSAGFAERSAVLAAAVARLLDQGVLDHLQDEPYPVTAGRRDQARALLDRAAAPLFGIRAFGQHLNGFVRAPQGLELWIGRRAADRRHYPNRLDHLVAGGLPHGLSLADNLRKECAEEAGIPAALADQARAVGVVTYCRSSRRGLKPDVIYCYDLELPADFVPRCTDGEVAAFYRMPAVEVMALVRDTDEFKLNCNLVLIDFLMRHGLIDPEDPEYLDLARGLRAPLPV